MLANPRVAHLSTIGFQSDPLAFLSNQLSVSKMDDFAIIEVSLACRTEFPSELEKIVDYFVSACLRRHNEAHFQAITQELQRVLVELESTKGCLEELARQVRESRPGQGQKKAVRKLADEQSRYKELLSQQSNLRRELDAPAWVSVVQRACADEVDSIWSQIESLLQ